MNVLMGPKKDVLTSVIIPCYNVAEFLSQTLRGLLSTDMRLELILVDDGSTDATWKLLQDFEKKDHRVRAFTKENGGVSSARNRGLDQVTGEYVYFLDADDRVSPDMFSKLNGVCIEEVPEIECFLFNYGVIDDKGVLKKKYVNDLPEKNFQGGEEILRMFWKKELYLHISCMAFRASKLKEMQLKFNEDLRYGEDQDFFIRYLLKSGVVSFKPQLYFHYVKRSGSAMDSKLTTERLKVLRYWKELILDLKIKRSDGLEDEFLSYWNIMFFFLLWSGFKRGANSEYFSELAVVRKKMPLPRLGSSKQEMTCWMLSMIYRFLPKIFEMNFSKWIR